MDDLGGVHDAKDAWDAFQAFITFCTLLGIRLKTSKAQSPAVVQSLLGVRLSVLESGVEVAPEPKRIEKLRRMIQDILAAGSLSLELASRLAGKMNFVQSTAFGKMGAAALRPVYARAHANLSTEALNTGLEAALRALLLMLGGLKPRFVPFAAQGVSAQVYSDAYFELGDRHWKPGDPDLPLQWSTKHALDSPNGWGFIVRVGASITYGQGAVSKKLLQRFTSRRAFIYFLEIYAQLIAFFAHLEVLPPYWISFIDNSSGLAALQKGYGRDPAVNLLLTLFWSVAGEQSCHGCPSSSGCRPTSIWQTPCPVAT